MNILLPFLMLMMSGAAEAQAPPLRFERVLQDGAEAKLSTKGKAVVLDFWTTWCSPCVAANPHWNKLVKEFEERPVVFVAATDEQERVVRSFLEKRPIRGVVAIDSDASVFKAFGVKGRPFTVLIDRSGRVAGYTDTFSLRAKDIEDLLQ